MLLTWLYTDFELGPMLELLGGPQDLLWSQAPANREHDDGHSLHTPDIQT